MFCDKISQNYISDDDFLNLMIKHHNVAINMSKLILINSQDDVILSYARKVIYNQSYEVFLMEKLIKTKPNIQNFTDKNINKSLSYNIDKIYPNIFTNYKCDDLHFENHIQLQFENVSKPKELFTLSYHINDKQYVDHMVAHHNSGIQLSKLVIKSTKEPKILMLAQNIILDQEKEMFELVNLYKCIQYNWRK
jgi:uncharacterized protein (DUF305 family)